MYDSIIIGGGVAGLYCACLQRQEGRDVLLCEKDSLGGSIKTTHQDGFTLEHGPNVFLENPEFTSALTRLGLTDNIIYPAVPSYKQYVWYNGKPRRVPRSPGINFCTTPLIAFKDKIALIPRALRKGVLAPKAQDESVAVFAARLVGKTAVERLVDPALKGIYGGNAESLSARSLFSNIWNHSKSGESLIAYFKHRKKESDGKSSGRKIFVLKGGMETLVSALAASLPAGLICTREAVSVSHGSGHFTVEFSDGERACAREVFVASSGPATAALLKNLDAELSRRLALIPYAALAVVHVSAPRTSAIPADSFGILFPRGLPSRLLGVMYNSALFPHLAPSNRHLLTVCLGGVGQEDICGRSAAELFSIVADELNDKLAIRDVDMLACHTWPRAIPQYVIGHWEIVAAMERLEKNHPGLHIIGVDRSAISVPDRVKTVSRLVKERLMPSSEPTQKFSQVEGL